MMANLLVSVTGSAFWCICQTTNTHCTSFNGRSCLNSHSSIHSHCAAEASNVDLLRTCGSPTKNHSLSPPPCPVARVSMVGAVGTLILRFTLMAEASNDGLLHTLG